jgi:hypothetical protein
LVGLTLPSSSSPPPDYRLQLLCPD